MSTLIVEQPPQGAEIIATANSTLKDGGDTVVNIPPILQGPPKTEEKLDAILQVTISPVPDEDPATQPDSATSDVYDSSKIAPGDSERVAENDESQSDDYSTVSDSDRRRDPKKFRRFKKEIAEAEKQFVRKGGITYVSDDIWVRMSSRAVNCHIFVSSTVADNTVAFLKEAEKSTSTEDASIQQKTRTRSRSPCLSDKGTKAGDEAGAYKDDATTSGRLPFRFRIVNELLKKEMQQIIGTSDLNHDHVPPFRSIVPFEEQFRRLHELKEAEFHDICHKLPDHPAVRRKKQFLPTRLAYVVSGPRDVTVLDATDTARILLDGLRALVQFLDTDLRDLVATVRRLKLGRVINNVPRLPFSHLWYLFAPGQEIVTRLPRPQVYRVLQVTGGRRSLVPRDGSKPGSGKTVSDLTIDCFYLDFDGKQFGPKPFKISIRPYSDLLPVTSLPAYPLIYDEQAAETALVERGKKFEGLVQPSHRRYKGLSLKEEGLFDTFEEIDSAVIVDFQLAFLKDIPATSFGGGVTVYPTVEDDAETNEPGLWYDDPELIQGRWSGFIHGTELLQNQPPGSLKRDSHILLPVRVYGFVLLSRKWYPLDIDLIEEVPKVQPGENDGFQKLVLPPGHRDIVRALVNTHARQVAADGKTEISRAQREFDVVKGKGKGLIILLHGAPGVGKTSTAECVAANAGRPLFPITCGDLAANTAAEVEANLDKFFDLARKWNCVLLLDEADVFLGARRKGDIVQNSLVSVFLRVLEYYSGILILTTNRVGSFDEAIKSRVHCALYYPPLEEEQTFKVWQMNLDILEERNKEPDCKLRVRMDRPDIEDYARSHWKSGESDNRWNGRQIKNAFQTAVALADWDTLKYTGGKDHPEGPLLERRHFDTVAKASAHFDLYLRKVRGTDQFRAKDDEVRRDDVALQSRNESINKTKKASSGKGKLKPKAKPKSPEPSDNSPAEEDLDYQSESSGSSSENQLDESKEEPPSPVPETLKKKRHNKKSRETW